MKVSVGYKKQQSILIPKCSHFEYSISTHFNAVKSIRELMHVFRLLCMQRGEIEQMCVRVPLESDL